MNDPKLIFTGPSEIGWHAHANILKCPRYYYLDKLPQAHPSVSGHVVEAIALGKGSLFHVMLAHHYVADKSKYYDPVTALTVASKLPDFENVRASDVDMLRDAYQAYCAKWQFDKDQYEVLGVEVPISGEIGGYKYTARVDLIVRYTGRVFFVDHKTTSSLRGDTGQGYVMDGQFMGQRYLGREMYGAAFGGTIINLIQLRPPHKFSRSQDTAAPGQEEAFATTVKYARRLMERVDKITDIKQIPRVPSEHTCMNRYGKCRFWDVCRYS